MAVRGKLHVEHRARVALIGTSAVFVALVAAAFAIGGSGGGSNAVNGTASHGAVTGGLVPVAAPPGLPSVEGYARAETAPEPVPSAAAAYAKTSSSATGGVGAGSAAGGVVAAPPRLASDASASDSDSSVAATKIVKNGELTIRVDKANVQSVVGRLSTLATAQGGYVSSSSTNTGGGQPSGEVVLRIPAAHFTDAINAAEGLGKLLSLTTSADDVTGHYVDLAAREHALVQTRETYLTILGRARTIGATLEVQDRIQGVQSQIEQLQGQLKVLSNQASYSTLTVDVTPDALVASVHHARHGLSKAWHTSWSRFGRGIDSMVGAIGPIVLAALLLALLAGVGVVGYRGVRRVTN